MKREPWLVQIIAEEVVILLAVARAYRDTQVDVITASNLDQALAQIEAFDFDLFLLDLDIKNGDSLSLLKKISRDSPEAPVVLMTTRSLDCPTLNARITELRPHGCWHLLEKPFDFRKLKSYIDRGLAERLANQQGDTSCGLDEPGNPRRCRRFPRNEPFRFTLPATSQTRQPSSYAATLIDISVGGLGITSDIYLEPRQPISFDEKFMHQSGVVVWSQPTTDQSFRAGIRFT